MHNVGSGCIYLHDITLDHISASFTKCARLQTENSAVFSAQSCQDASLFEILFTIGQPGAGLLYQQETASITSVSSPLNDELKFHSDSGMISALAYLSPELP